MSRARIAALALGLSLSAPALAINETFTVTPAAPAAGQEFTLTISGMTGCTPVAVDSVNVNVGTSRIDVHAVQGTEACFSPPTTYTVSRTLRATVPLAYDLTYQVDSGTVATLGRVTIAAATASTITFPFSPRAGEDFVIQLEGVGCGPFDEVRTELAGNVITVAYQEAPACFGVQPPGATFLSAVMRVPAAGNYEVRYRSANSSGSRGTLSIAAPSTATRTPVVLGGLWYVPQQPGWGLNIIEGESGQLFLIWFTYSRGVAIANRGAASWYVGSSGKWVTPTRFVAPIYSALGPVLGVPFDPALVRLTPLGIATIDVASANTLTFSVDGAEPTVQTHFTRNLTKFRF